MKYLEFKIFVLIILSSYCVKAQTVNAVLDSSVVEFANPVRLKVSATVTSGNKTYFPNLKELFKNSPLELLSELKPDTSVSQDRKMVTFTHTYVITSFKDTLLYVPRLPIRIGKDTLYTDSLSIAFTLLQNTDSTFLSEIDTTKIMKVFDIKDVKNAPWTFQEFWARFSKLILILLIVAVLASVLTYMYIRWKNNKPILPVIKPKEPADKTALRELEKLKDEKLWQQQERTKEYYSRLTEILKRYISDRYSTSVMELTSMETLEKLADFVDPKDDCYQGLRFVFSIADFVKFAKMQPLLNENEKALNNAFDFVEKTKKVVVESENKEEEKNV